MITLFSGIPRSGKTYLMTAETWKLKDKYFIIHNIVGFKTELLKEFGFNWAEYIDKENIEVDYFFSKEYQQELSKKINEKYNRPMLIIIDEAHEWFDVHKKAIKMWLSYHGHLNQQVYLVAHASTNIPKVYRTFVEVEYRAKSSSFLFFPGYFFYNRILGGVRSGYKMEKKDQKIFDLYKSSDIEGKKQKKSVYIPLLIGLVILGFFLFIISPKIIFHKFGEKKKDVTVDNKNPVSNINGSQNKTDQKAIALAIESFDKTYAYVGIINDQPVFEDRKSGFQYPINRIPGEFKFVRSDRANNCLVFGKDFKFYYVYNFDRYVEKEAAPTASSLDIGQIDNRATNGRYPLVRTDGALPITN